MVVPIAAAIKHGLLKSMSSIDICATRTPPAKHIIAENRGHNSANWN